MKQHRPTPRALAAPVLALALLATSSGAMAEIIDVAWSASGQYERTVGVAAGNLVEVCDKLPAGTKVGWKFEASSALDFDIHYHVGKEVTFPIKLSAVSRAQDTLDTRIEQVYCWTWRNKSSAAATVTVSLQR